MCIFDRCNPTGGEHIVNADVQGHNIGEEWIWETENGACLRYLHPWPP